MNTTTFNYFTDTATTRKQPKMGQVRLSMRQIIEEPCEVKVSSTVLKTSGEGDSLTEFNKWAIEQLSKIATVHTRLGWQTYNLRKHLGLAKSKNKAEQTPESHANDGITLACFRFLDYLSFHTSNGHGHELI